MMDSIPRQNQRTFVLGSSHLRKLYNKIYAKIKSILLDSGWLFFIVGFLLGRAIILSVVSPFSVALLATMWFTQKKKTFKVMLAIMIGALTHSMNHTVFVTIAMLMFILLASLFKNVKEQQIIIPSFVFISTVGPRLFIYSIETQLSTYEWMLLFVEGVLGTVLVLIFMQSIPLLSLKKYKPILKNEEIVCLIILIASVLTGTIGWEVYGASIEQVFSRYFVLMLSFVGGAAIGSTVGVVVGLILSLANAANLFQMSLLAFSGLLGGLLKDGKKIGVSAGLLVGTFLISIYGDAPNIMPSILESSIAI